MPGIPLTRILQFLAGAALAAPAFFSTSLAAAADAPSYSGVFEKAFQPNFSVESQAPQSGGTKKAETVPFKTFDIGRLIIKSGQICAADPFVGIGATKPFTQAVPNGTFPVRLAVGFHPAGTVKDNRVAFARVDFSSAPVVRWSQALIEGQDPATLKPGEMFGYPVDAGTGSFCRSCSQRCGARAFGARPERNRSLAERRSSQRPQSHRPIFVRIDAAARRRQRRDVPFRLGRRILCLVFRVRRSRKRRSPRHRFGNHRLGHRDVVI